MNIDTVYKMTNFVLNKAQTGNANPARFNLAVNMANRALFKRYRGIPEISDRGGNAMTFSESTNIEEVMRLFKKKTTLYIDPSGVSSLPSDFVREDSLTYKTQNNGVTHYNPIKICNDLEFQEAQYSYIVPATKDNPVCRFVGTNVEFLPVNLVNAQMTYLRMPNTPVWGYTVTSNRPVYDAGSSVDVEFPDDVIDDFIMLTVQFLGVTMQRQDIINYTEQYKQNGQ